MSLLDEIDELFANPVFHPEPSTDEVDHTTPEERRALVAYCEFCEAWWHFVRNMDPTPEEATCPKCGGRPSQRHGYQMTSERTFSEKLKRKRIIRKK